MSDPLPSTLPRELTRDEIARAVVRLLDPAVSDDERARFLVALSDKGETGAELAGFAEALLPHAVPIPAPAVKGPLLDCCGTGGGGLSIFNVSTAAMFVLAAGGVPVVKHGNRGVTKPSGSADVMEALKLRVVLEPEEVGRSLADLGFAFLYAPAFHPAFQVLGPVRKTLGAQGRRTVFNLLGPLLNPLKPGARLVGVFKEAHVGLYEEALRALDCRHYGVVFGQVGGCAVGEVGSENVWAVQEGKDLSKMLRQGSPAVDLEAVKVADALESAALIRKVLDPKEKGDAVESGRTLLMLNAGAAFYIQGKADSYQDGCAWTNDLLRSGAALARLRKARRWAVDHPEKP